MKHKPVDLSKVRTYPLRERKSKVRAEDFVPPVQPGDSFKEFLNHIPRILAGRDFFQLVESIVKASGNKKMVLANIGAHVIKCGLSRVIIQLMEKGVFTGLSMNGAGSIHDFEIALVGETSEEVEVAIKDGSLGMAEEIGKLMNEAINAAKDNGLGMGEALGGKLLQIKAPHSNLSILARAIQLNIPLTVHVAIGTDIIHQHPLARGEAMGETSFRDFKLLTSLVSQLGSGGVVLNFGSAVIFPEVFLKALSIARNLGYEVKDFTTANFDIIEHYRPIQNVVCRPVSSGGKGYSFIGHHQIMIPLLAGAILEKLNEG